MGGIVMGISSFVYNYTHINTIIIAFMTIIKIKHRLWNPWNKKCAINGILSKINLKASHYTLRKGKSEIFPSKLFRFTPLLTNLMISP